LNRNHTSWGKKHEVKDEGDEEDSDAPKKSEPNPVIDTLCEKLTNTKL